MKSIAVLTGSVRTVLFGLLPTPLKSEDGTCLGLLLGNLMGSQSQSTGGTLLPGLSHECVDPFATAPTNLKHQRIYAKL